MTKDDSLEDRIRKEVLARALAKDDARKIDRIAENQNIGEQHSAMDLSAEGPALLFYYGHQG